MTPAELDIGTERTGPRATPRRAALNALERLLRAHVALGEQRDRESPYGLLRPAREEELGLVEATFLHCGVPLPDTLRAIYRRTLGVGNPVSSVPVLAVPVLRAILPDDGFGPPVVGLDAFEQGLGIARDEAAAEHPPFLVLGHAAPLGLSVSRNGLWSLGALGGRAGPPGAGDFGLTFEVAFRRLVEQVLLAWANDLAGAPVRPRDLDVTRGARLAAMPPAVRDAMSVLLAPRTLGPRSWEEVHLLDGADLLRATRRGAGAAVAGPQVTVVGLPYGDRPELADRIRPGDLLRPVPVDDNPHDPEAVEVWLDDGRPVRVGFVARDEAAGVRALPDGAPAWRLRVQGRTENALYALPERTRPEDPAPDASGAAPDGDGPDLFSHR